MPEAPPTQTELALEQSGLEFLRNGKFRKARDAFKTLNKTQPTRALPLLIEANLGLANEMMSKGLVSEANQVLAYLKTIAPASYDLTVSPPTKQTSRDAWFTMVALAEQRLATTTQSDAAIRAADEIILGAESPDHPAHPDAKAILNALELGYGAALSEQTTPLLRSVSRLSPFSHWVFFFKGMTALESGAHARAVEYFRKIPEKSLLQSSLPALLTLCGAPPSPKPTSQTVRALCEWSGNSSMADPLFQADLLWKKKQYSKAFKLLIQKIPGLMCWGARSFKADLSRFFTTRMTKSHLIDHDYSDALLEYASRKSNSIAEAVLDQAFLSIDFEDYPSCAHNHYQGVVRKVNDISEVVPIHPAMRSRIFTNLAKIYIDSIKKDPRRRCSPPNAKKALEEAILCDPSYLHAWVTQCDLLAMGMDTSAYHRFLDDLTKRFPEEKEVLIRNGVSCYDRKSFTKALRNFQNAAKLDSVDPRIHQGILRSHLGIAEELYKKGNSSKVNWPLIENLASTHKSYSEFSLWRLRVLQIVFVALHCKNTEILPSLVADTLPIAPNEFLLHFACRFVLARKGFKAKKSLIDKVFSPGLAPQSLADFCAVMDELGLSGFDHNFTHLSLSIFMTHEQRLLKCTVERSDIITLLIKIFSFDIPNLSFASPVLEKWFARDPSDPILQYLCACYGFHWLKREPHYDLKAIIADIKNAKNPNDHRLLVLLEKNRNGGSSGTYSDEMEGSSKLDLDYDPHGKDEDDFHENDDDYDNFIDDEFEDEEFLEHLFGSDIEEALSALDDAAASMDPSRLEALLREFIARGGDMGVGGGIPFGGPPMPQLTNPFVPQSPQPAKPKTPKPAPKAPKKPLTPEEMGQLNFDAQVIPPPRP